MTPKEKAREEVKAILKVLPTVTNKDLRAHLLKEKSNLENVIALHEVREKEAQEFTRAKTEERVTRRETRIIR